MIVQGERGEEEVLPSKAGMLLPRKGKLLKCWTDEKNRCLLQMQGLGSKFRVLEANQLGKPE
jgi:hypothetical protein